VSTAEEGEEAISLAEFRSWIQGGRAVARLARYREARILVDRLDTAMPALPLAAALRPLTRGAVYVEDVSGRRRRISTAQILAWAARFAAEPFQVAGLLRSVGRELDALESSTGVHAGPVDLTCSPVYLRTDLSFGVRAGGSVAHIAGVLNALSRFTASPIFLTTDDVPTVSAGVETHFITPNDAFWNFRELPALVLNRTVEALAKRSLGRRPLAFVYQRHSLNNYAGIRIARAHRVPFVLEYNGSEIWMSRHWGRPIKYEALAGRIEQLNLSAADLVVVVSRAMEDELIERGVDRTRILVNVNGVDEHRYNPEIDGSAIRERYGLTGKTVVGFIGTFGPWHGAEVLARAFASFGARFPDLRASMRLLMIGDGSGAREARRIITEAGADDVVVWTGLVPQAEGPRLLAACDVLASPHVPNPDGSPFFGSPTKLFEYMAMGKAIVASNLEQIGEVLDHGRTAWLVTPGDVEQLADGIRRLALDPTLRRVLGDAARREVVDQYTWRQHTRRTIGRLQAIAGRHRAAAGA
jgi:glycosyltransferase involved in cell wall biosynthesis